MTEQMVLFDSIPTLETSGKRSGSRLSRLHTVGSSEGSLVTPTAGDPHGLRGYQREAVNAILRELETVRSTLAVMFTGAGKTQVGGSVIRSWNKGRILWLAHRDELLSQAQRRIEAMTGRLTSLEQAGQYASGTQVVVGSVQSLRGSRLERWPHDQFGLVIIDEAHHSPSKSYRAIVDHLSAAKVLGITATADRLDGVGQHNVFDTVAYRKDIFCHHEPRCSFLCGGIDEGYLVPMLCRSAFIDSVNLAKIKTVSGDLALDALEEEILKAAAGIVDATLAEVGDRRSLTFTPGVASAHKVCDTHNQRHPGSAHVVDGKTHPDKRREIFKAHRRGEFQHLVNCMVATEGYDDVGIAAIVNARPTKSRALATQIWGRGLRVLPGIGELPTVQDRLSAIAASAKPNCLLLDATGHPGKHKLISPLDLLAGKYASDVVAKAKDAVAKEAKLMEDALEEAVIVVREEDEERRKQEARAAADAEVRRRSGEWDPFLDGGVKDPDAMRPAFLGKPSTPRQKAWAIRNFLSPELSAERLSKLFKLNLMRDRFGKATFRLLGLLRKHGLPAGMETTTEQARQMLRGREWT